MKHNDLLFGAEEWRAIPGYEGYEASSWGRVRSVPREVSYRGSWKAGAYTMMKPGRVLKPAPKKSGHLKLMLGRGVHLDVHVAVALAFHGPKPENCEVLHADHNPANNVPANLSWGTRRENLMQDFRRGHRTVPVPNFVRAARARAAQ